MHARGFGLRRIVHAGALALLTLVTLDSHALTREDCERDYHPQRGQRGKDVIWVPTSDFMVARMLELAKVGETDIVYDLGAGDGKIAIAAARRHGAAAVGIEYNALLVRYAKCLVEAEGVKGRVSIHEGDIFEVDFHEATVVTLYLVPSLNLRLRPKLLDLKPGTRVVSHSFPMGEWEPDDRSFTPFGRAYLWIVPAKVAGTWRFARQGGPGEFTAHLEQNFQKITGTAGIEATELEDATLRGAQIEFTFRESGEKTRVRGQVSGNHIEARVTRNRTPFRYTGTLMRPERRKS